jgi:CRP/FNR family transcriptional regulator
MQRKKTGPRQPLRQVPQGCSVCTLQPACLPWELEPADIENLERIVDRSATVTAGKHLFRFGEPLRSVYVVRSGAFKNYRMDAGGRERVLGFILPGELVGVDGIYPRRHESNAIALGDSAICELPYAELTALMERSDGLRRQMLRLVSRDGVYTLGFSLDSTADQRIATFLLNLSHRAQTNGRSATELELLMSHQDIASYLRMHVESVTRILDRFSAEGMLKLDGRHLTLLDLGQIGDVASRH